MQNILKLLILFLISGKLIAQNVSVSEPSSWVEIKEVTNNAGATESGAINYFLLDYQDNVNAEETYTHVSYEVLNDEGVQSYSNISIDFDPSYQELVYHKVVIKRKGELINKLHLSDITTIQRESDMNRNLYDGSLTSYINLTDVRSGDIIEYSYTLKGFNPVLNGNYASSYFQDFTIPVEKMHLRVISDKKIHFKGVNDAVFPTITGNEYVFDIDPKYIQYEPNTPNWYFPNRKIYLSTFKDWEQIADWAVPLYSLSMDEVERVSNKLREEISFDGVMEENIVKAIRFVQDEVRYLGFESGIKGYKPHDPSLVLERRFGDCKDKSNLLVAILKSLNVEAFPMLVSTYKKHSIDREQSSPYSFDHCVVNFKYADKSYLIDPTINNQGGSLDSIQFPNYERGLIVSDKTNELLTTGKTQEYKQLVEETLTVHGVEMDSKVTLDVATTYYSASADNIRSYFKNNSIANITRDYTTFYSNLYPSIASLDDVNFEDARRGSTNEVIVYESYEIENFWSEYQESGLLGEAYGLLIESYLSAKAPSKRSSPYYLGGPVEIEERIKLVMPEEWNVTAGDVKVQGNGFYYESVVGGNENEIDLSFILRLDSSYLSASNAKGFLEKRDEIQDDLLFNITHGGEFSDNSQISWKAILVTLLAFVGALWVGRNVYYNYNPETLYKEKHNQIGGWLVLLAIGITLTPLRMAYAYTDLIEYWQAASWQNIKLAYSDTYFELSALIVFELIFNTVFIVFSVLVAIVFYQRRTSAPTLITYFIVLNLAFIILDSIIAQLIFKDDSFSESLGEIGKSVIYATIWVSYLHQSTRVKGTFTRIYQDGYLVQALDDETAYQ